MGKKENFIKNFNISKDSLVNLGNEMYKLDPSKFKGLERKGKLVLLTAINPTKYGEGKTTCSIGLADALSANGKKTVLALREPSMGPVFGSKGTATGGGECEIEPMDRINLNFTGDFHAISSANNLIAAAIDSHIYWGNKLDIDINSIVWSRCMDVNDRGLRNISYEIKKGVTRVDQFVITAASKMMAAVSLASDSKDLRERLKSTIFAKSTSGKDLTLDKLSIVGSVMAILDDALKPNLVFSKYDTPALVHCGPFANIATGTNSAISTDLALKISDYVVTECGFATDLGFQKYAEIIQPLHNFTPNCVLLVVTVRALKYHGDYDNGFALMKKHIKNIQQVTKDFAIVINQFVDDKEEDLQLLKAYLEENYYNFEVNTSYVDGPSGAIDLAKLVEEICDSKTKFKPLLSDNLSVKEKIEKIAKDYYHLKHIAFNDVAEKQLIDIQKDVRFNKWPIVIAKSQNSIDGNDAHQGNYVMTISKVEINSVARFILAYTNKILMMPGLPKDANYIDIDVVDGKVINMK